MQWKTIDAAPLYEVSNSGRVRSKKTGRVLAIRRNNKGRWCVRLYNGSGKAGDHQVHRLVLEAFVGPAPEGMECRHLDGNHENNHLENLVWGTHTENMRDKILHGTNRNGGAPRRYSEEQIAEMRRLRSDGVSYPKLAKTFGCALGTARKIVLYETYFDLP